MDACERMSLPCLGANELSCDVVAVLLNVEKNMFRLLVVNVLTFYFLFYIFCRCSKIISLSRVTFLTCESLSESIICWRNNVLRRRSFRMRCLRSLVALTPFIYKITGFKFQPPDEKDYFSSKLKNYKTAW